MKIDYNILAQKYDLTRTANINIINMFAEEISLANKNILDFGCGTGNFAYAMKKLTASDIYGVEPSDGMREKALQKGDIIIEKGDHENIPFDDNFFDFIYMTDVIHHVPDLNAMFSEFYRILKQDGCICILTESHAQLETRFWVKYFPTTVEVEKKRYPDIPKIISAAKNAKIIHRKTVTTDKINNLPHIINITEDFVKLVENKGYSMFDLIDEADYTNGLKYLREDYKNKIDLTDTHGETLLWLRKQK